MAEQGEDEIEQALSLIHRRATEYEGPRWREFQELARVSAPFEEESQADGASMPRQGQIKRRFHEALSLLMVLGFPMHRGTEASIRAELSEQLRGESQISKVQFVDDGKRISLTKHLPRRPTRSQLALQRALLRYLPYETEVDL